MMETLFILVFLAVVFSLSGLAVTAFFFVLATGAGVKSRGVGTGAAGEAANTQSESAEGRVIRLGQDRTDEHRRAA